MNKIKEMWNYKMRDSEKILFLLCYAGGMLVLGIFLGKWFG